MNKYLFMLAASLLFSLTGCTNSKKGFRVAATPVPHAQMLEFVKPELKAKGIDLVIVVTDDYNMPNRALANHELDANFFQHIPFMEEQINQFHYAIESLAKIEIEPMGIYSKKIQSLSQLPENATIAIPNDPTNEARALRLLEENKVIQLNSQSDLQITVLNIVKNPKNIKFVEVDAAMLPRSLEDVDAAAINTNYSLQAGLTPDVDALALENLNSPYVNIITIRTGDENRPEIQALKEVMTSEKMRKFILDTYQGAVVPVF